MLEHQHRVINEIHSVHSRTGLAANSLRGAAIDLFSSFELGLSVADMTDTLYVDLVHASSGQHSPSFRQVFIDIANNLCSLLIRQKDVFNTFAANPDCSASLMSLLLTESMPFFALECRTVILICTILTNELSECPTIVDLFHPALVNDNWITTKLQELSVDKDKSQDTSALINATTGLATLFCP